MDELGLIVIVCMYHTHFGIILKDRIWSTEYDNSSKYCKFFLMYQGGVSFTDTITGNWNIPSPPPLLLTIDDDVQEEAVNLVGERADPLPANTTSPLPLDMRNKNESEPDVKKDSDQNIDYLQTDLNANTEPKKDCDQQADYPKAAPEQKMDLDDEPSKPKVDSEVDLKNKPSLKMECSRTATDNRSSRPRKRMSPSSRCLRSSGSVCNKKLKKECSSRNSQKAGKTMYDLSDPIRGKGHSKPQRKPKPKSKPKKKARKNSRKTDERNNKTEQEVQIKNSMPNDVNIEKIDAIDVQKEEGGNKTE